MDEAKKVSIEELKEEIKDYITSIANKGLFVHAMQGVKSENRETILITNRLKDTVYEVDRLDFIKWLDEIDAEVSSYLNHFAHIRKMGEIIIEA